MRPISFTILIWENRTHLEESNMNFVLARYKIICHLYYVSIIFNLVASHSIANNFVNSEAKSYNSVLIQKYLLVIKAMS